MNNIIDEKLERFLFPVEEKPVYTGEDKLHTGEYKAIVRPDTDELISIMKNSYQLIPNREIIMPLLEQLHELDSRWYIDGSHSFAEPNRMRLQVTFPDLTLNDGRSDIALSLFVHNSYDGSEGVRMFWGAIRGICSNGMVFGQVLAKFYGKHTKGLDLSNLKSQLETTYQQIPVIKERISVLQNLNVNHSQLEEVTEKLGKKAAAYVAEQPTPENQWILYNYLTYFISHLVDQSMRAAYQMKVSKLFRL